MAGEGNGFDEYRKLIMRELDRLTTEIRHSRNNHEQGLQGLYERLIETEKHVATLQVKCGIFGLLGGLIPTVTAMVISKV
tara:strand:+ start:270 stop:509 length:240 start_codon:yes stop_codon:yes gene_type:complete